jgi:xanthosine phosphorylase
MQQKYHDILTEINSRIPSFKPKIGMILGSGLGAIADSLENAVSISYQDIPHFFKSTVQGHQGRMVLGWMSGVPVVCMQGRIHVYEGADPESFKIFIRTLKLLGCESLIITNAAGSFREEVGPGSLCLVTDHINMQHRVPLIGPNDDEFGSRFFAMDNAYDIEWRKLFLQTADKLGITLHQGVFLGVTGPCFETPAEIRAFRLLGADLTAMSMVPEVIIARHCAMKVAGISVVTNLASGMTNTSVSHEETLHYGKIGAENLSRLIQGFVKEIGNNHAIDSSPASSI